MSRKGVPLFNIAMVKSLRSQAVGPKPSRGSLLPGVELKPVAGDGMAGSGYSLNAAGSSNGKPGRRLADGTEDDVEHGDAGPSEDDYDVAAAFIRGQQHWRSWRLSVINTRCRRAGDA